MHVVLLITEVRGSILDFLVVDTVRYPRNLDPNCYELMPRDTRRAGRRALSALARTCRALSEPALNALWHRLHNLEPLLRCARAKKDVAELELDSLAPFNEEEWDIVLRYAHRVRELTVSPDDAVSVKILQALWFHTTLLLPNLRKLDWSYNGITQFSAIRLLLGPSLVDLFVRLGNGDYTSILGFLERYHMISPNIKSLWFSHLFRIDSLVVVAAISRAISRSPNLEVLTCDEIDEDAIIHLIRSSSLEKLSARLRYHHPDNLRRLAGCSTPDFLPFRNLRVLNLYVEDISSVTPYLRSTHQPFEEVSLEFFLITLKDLHEFLSALNSSTRRQTLRRIWLVDSGPTRIETTQLNFELFRPLLAFSLRVLDANLRFTISLNDDELVQLVQAWPELETLNLNQYNVLTPSRLPSLRGLLLVLARCPKLHTLGLCVDARTIPVLMAEESTICNTFVKTLELQNSPIVPPLMTDVAQFLLDYFPSLSGLTSKGSLVFSADRNMGSYIYRAIWREVSMQIEEARRENAEESGDSDSEMDINVV